MHKVAYVAGLMFFREEVLMIKKNHPEDQKGKLNGIGGKIETGETSAEAMCREFEEECGIITTPPCWTYLASIGGMEWNVDWFGIRVNPFPNYTQTTDESLHIIDWNALPANTMNWVRAVGEEFLNWERIYCPRIHMNLKGIDE